MIVLFTSFLYCFVEISWIVEVLSTNVKAALVLLTVLMSSVIYCSKDLSVARNLVFFIKFLKSNHSQVILQPYLYKYPYINIYVIYICIYLIHIHIYIDMYVHKVIKLKISKFLQLLFNSLSVIHSTYCLMLGVYQEIPPILYMKKVI